MNNFNNNDEPQETVRQTLERVWREKEQQKQPSYAAKNHLARALPRETYIKSDRNYAWTVPHKYDHRPDNIWAQIHNFSVMNKEHPVQKPITTGNRYTDMSIMRTIATKLPYVAKGLSAYNLGYMGAGYYDNWKRAKEVVKRPELPEFNTKNKFFLKNK